MRHQMNLERLAYISHSTNPAGTLGDVSAILAQSISNNRPNNITGALAHTAFQYVQVLEGSHGSLDVLLLKLAMDPRHRDMVVLDRIPIQSRPFAEWEMLSPPFTSEAGRRLNVITSQTKPQISDVTRLIFEMEGEQVGMVR